MAGGEAVLHILSKESDFVVRIRKKDTKNSYAGAGSCSEANAVIDNYIAYMVYFSYEIYIL